MITRVTKCNYKIGSPLVEEDYPLLTCVEQSNEQFAPN